MSVEQALSNLRQAHWLHRPATQTILALLDGQHGITRAVGGVVRDTLLGRDRETAEVDFATELLPTEVTKRAKAANIPVYPTGIDHGTVTLRIGAEIFEVTTLRQDIDTDGRHAKVEFGKDWRRDAARRDFTMNALYGQMDGTLFDPLGGIDDCMAGTIKFIGVPEQRIAEDRLRVYRFFRFSASHGGQTYDPAGLAACAKFSAAMAQLSAERIGAEMRRMLQLPRIATTLSTMAKAKILSVDQQVLDHLSAYESCTEVPLYSGRLALISRQGNLKKLQKNWRLSNLETKQVSALHAATKLFSENKNNEVAYRFPDCALEAVPLAAVLNEWSLSRLNDAVDFLTSTKVPIFPISGQDLVDLGIAPGPMLGKILKKLEISWINSTFTLSKNELKSLI